MINNAIDNDDKVISYEKDLNEVYTQIDRYEKELQGVSELQPLAKEYHDKLTRIKNCQLIISYEKQTELAENLAYEGLAEFENIKDITALIKPYKECVASLEKLEVTLEHEKSLKDLSIDIQEYEAILSKLKFLIEYRDKYLSELKSIKYNENFIKEKEKEFEGYIKRYEQLLKKLGTCPTCHTNIDDEVIKHIVNDFIANRI
jgi:DNA repair ATPase RecN